MDNIQPLRGDDFAEPEIWDDLHMLGARGVTGDVSPACDSNQGHPAGEAIELDLSEPPPKGTFLDETMVIRDPEGESLITAIVGLFDTHRKPQRKAHAREVENERSVIGCMVANGLRCHWHRDPPLVAYQRKADGYSEKRNRPDWLSGRALGRSAELFAAVRLFTLHLGRRWTASSYSVTPSLLALAEEHGVTEQSLRMSLNREDLVQLKGPRPRPTWNFRTRKLVRHKAPRIYFDPTPQTEEWRDRLIAYNAFVAAQDIRVSETSDLVARWVSHLNGDQTHTGASFARPELFRNSVYRVFNDGRIDEPTFDRGGRLVGSWWVNSPEEVRARITINGEPTVERDYSACHPRMLYHEQGLVGPADPYDIPEIAEYERQVGLEAGHYRSGVKWLTQVLINGRGRLDKVDFPDDVRLPPDIDIRDLAAMIERGHEPIASAFRTRAGVRLMKEESELALAIVIKAMEAGWTALSVHDSFVVPKFAEKELMKLMGEEYLTRIGVRPIID